MAKDNQDEEFSHLLKGAGEIEDGIKDILIDNLQNQLDDEKDKRREDLFVFIFLSVIFFDITIFEVMPNFGGPIAIVVLELVLFIPLARRMGMEDLVEIIDHVLGRVAKKIGGTRE